ncbi:piggyBac transposable element-derived protein 3-like [Hydra vulgaris]|uniref:PiggyBac transposable element-derived protein 3-like n=1 Tax=Hydra vulgaris TaxID=6087 RepID=A0ABM4DMJ2_HYDVU
MVPYFDKHSVKTYIKGKPIHFGYKLWALCGNDGYPYKLQIYTQKDSTRRSEIPIGQQVIQDMLEVVKQKSSPKLHEIYFENFFASEKLVKLFSEESFIATGTIRDNRTDGTPKDNIIKINKK